MHDVYENPALSDSARSDSFDGKDHIFLVVESRAPLINVKRSLAVLNSSPMNPSLTSQVLMANLEFSVCILLGSADFCTFAAWLSAKQS